MYHYDLVKLSFRYNREGNAPIKSTAQLRHPCWTFARLNRSYEICALSWDFRAGGLIHGCASFAALPLVAPTPRWLPLVMVSARFEFDESGQAYWLNEIET